MKVTKKYLRQIKETTRYLGNEGYLNRSNHADIDKYRQFFFLKKRLLSIW